jgi:surface polysaccharide O-acyltransferase-like enzyme
VKRLVRWCVPVFAMLGGIAIGTALYAWVIAVAGG